MIRATLFLFILLLHPALWASDINKTISNGDQAFYGKLLHGLEKNKHPSEEITLQKNLLHRLINLNSKLKSDPVEFTVPKDRASYSKLFAYFIEQTVLKHTQKQRLIEMTQHKELINDQISLMHNSDPAMMSRQLEYAFYHKAEKIYRTKVERRQKAIETLPALFLQGMSHRIFDNKELQEDIKLMTSEFTKLDEKIKKVKLEQDRLNLLEKNSEASRLSEKIKQLQDKRQNFIQEKTVILFELFSMALKNKSTEAFDYEDQLMSELKGLHNGSVVSEDLAFILKTMSTETLGTAKRISGAFMSEVGNVLSNIWKFINKPIVMINEAPLTLFKIIVSLIIFFSSFYLGSLYKKFINHYTRKKRSFKRTTKTLLANIGNYIIIISALFLSLNVLGINLTSIALIAGALSVGIGFGLQNIVSNFVSGLILMFERSIKVGDFIEINEQLRGHVMDIRMRSTTINTNSNIDVIVPNQDLIQKHVINWTMSDDIRRFDVPFGVAYGTDPQKVIDVVLEALHKSKFDDIYEDNDKKCRVVMNGMNESSVDFELLVWLKGENILYAKRTMSRFLVLVYNTLYQHNISIPFPQRDLHLRSVDKDALIQITSK